MNLRICAKFKRYLNSNLLEEKIILKNKRLILILVFMLILGVNTVFANETNKMNINMDNNNQNNDLNEDVTVKSSSNLEIDETTISDNDIRDIIDETDDVDSVHKNASISIKTNSITVDDDLLIYLKDTAENPIINRNLSVWVNNNLYNKTTDSNGEVSIKLSYPANYLIKVIYDGDSSYNSIDAEFNVFVNKKKTNAIIKTYSVINGQNLIIQLVDNKGMPVTYQNLIINILNKNYYLKTDVHGLINLKINFNPKQYTVKIKYSGDAIRQGFETTFKMNVYKLKTSFKIPKTKIIRRTRFIAYLKDNNGVPLVNARVKLSFKKKKIIRKTDKYGKISLKIKNKAGRYELKLFYGGSNSYLKAAKKVFIKSYKAKTKIIIPRSSVLKGKRLLIYLKDSSNNALRGKRLIITLDKKTYKRTTNKQGAVSIKVNARLGKHKLKVRFRGTGSYLKRTRSVKIKVNPIIKYNAVSSYVDPSKLVKYFIKVVDGDGNPIVGEKVSIKTKCNNFTMGTGRKITKKTIVLDSDNIFNTAKDTKLLNQIASLLRSKGYNVIVSGIGPNYHVDDVKNYVNVCVFTLVGGIDSGMFRDMASKYYQNYLKKNNNEVVLGCVRSLKGINLANSVWVGRARDDDYSPPSFTGLYFPGQYLNEKVHIDYVYGETASLLVSNFINYAANGKSIGMGNTLPYTYKTYELITDSNGCVSIDLPIGIHTIITSVQDNINEYLFDATLNINPNMIINLGSNINPDPIGGVM